MTTDDYGWLHQLTADQIRCIDALMSGATHSEAADLAGVHRVTVTKWTNHHPEFIAELNRRRLDVAEKAAAKVAELTTAALEAVSVAIADGNVDAALKFLRFAPLATITR